MLFNSLTFLIFLPIVFCLYWFAFGKSLRLQNLFVVVASYVFYGWWDVRFLGLIAFTSLWAWFFGVLDRPNRGGGRGLNAHGSKALLALSCIINLGILGVFKYYNFFADSATTFLNMLGFQAHAPTLRVLLPVGISFYTFQALSYTIDVYRRKLEPTRDPIAFFAFVSFFPQLVAGPIERATNLLPQFLKPRTFDAALATEGCRQMLWGFFKKMVVADGCAKVANFILLNDAVGRGGIAIWVAMACFTIQIYGDFSGYSDIAIGCSKLFGVRLMQNFATPYFSRDIAEFWRRWHISLTTWFRDYVYIPLGGSRCSKAKQVRNTFIVFLVSGFWHGANWTFLAWGAFHAFCFLPLLLLKRNRKNTDVVAEDRALPSIRELIQMGTTFFVALLGWTFFRAPSIATAFDWFRKMFTLEGGLTMRGMSGAADAINIVGWIAMFLIFEWINRKHAFGFARQPSWRIVRWSFYIVLAYIIFFLASGTQSFIYFQF